MTQFKFGIIWTVFITILFIIAFFNILPIPQVSIRLALFFIVLEGIGVFCIANGYAAILKNKKTDKYGINTFGRILDIASTGNMIGGEPELKASVVVYMPKLNSIQVFEEVIGSAPAKYDVGMYVNVKQYSDDVNIVSTVNKEAIPPSVIEKINDKNFKEDVVLDENGEVVKSVGKKYDNSRYIKTFTNVDW
ncbi:MAG: hypothetical protein IKI57_00685 [Clostridia bacterium]|nr:hypothetical protein [Clostridia bacterium]